MCLGYWGCYPHRLPATSLYAARRQVERLGTVPASHSTASSTWRISKSASEKLSEHSDYVVLCSVGWICQGQAEKLHRSIRQVIREQWRPTADIGDRHYESGNLRRQVQQLVPRPDVQIGLAARSELSVFWSSQQWCSAPQRSLSWQTLSFRSRWARQRSFSPSFTTSSWSSLFDFGKNWTESSAQLEAVASRSFFYMENRLFCIFLKVYGRKLNF